MFVNVRQDMLRYLGQERGMARLKAVLYMLLTQEFHALMIFRFGKWARIVRIPLVGFLLRILYFVSNKLIAEICAGVLLDLGSEIGPGFQLGHFGGIYIKAKIGKNCTISQQVVIGHKGGFSGGGVPEIGDNVFVGSGAKIIGAVRIGDNVKVGANAVVVEDVPENSTVVGVPGRVIRK